MAARAITPVEARLRRHDYEKRSPMAAKKTPLFEKGKGDPKNYGGEQHDHHFSIHPAVTCLCLATKRELHGLR